MYPGTKDLQWNILTALPQVTNWYHDIRNSYCRVIIECSMSLESSFNNNSSVKSSMSLRRPKTEVTAHKQSN